MFSFWVFGILDILTVNKITVTIINEPASHPCLIFLWNVFVYFWLFNFVCSTLKHSIVTTVDSYRALFEINEECLQDVLSFLQNTNVKSAYKNKMNVSMNVRTYNGLGM